MPLTNRKKYKRSTILAVPAVLFSLIGLYYYFCIENTAWFPELMKQFPVAPDQVPSYARLGKWILGAILFVVNFMLLGKIQKRLQIVLTILELLALLTLFMATFQLSFEFIASKIGYLITQGAFTPMYVKIGRESCRERGCQ